MPKGENYGVLILCQLVVIWQWGKIGTHPKGEKDSAKSTQELNWCPTRK